MKAKINKKNNFKPFKIELEIETQEEAGMLFKLFQENNLNELMQNRLQIDRNVISRDFNYEDRCNICEILLPYVTFKEKL